MKKIVLSLLLFTTFQFTLAQQITLDKIYSGYYRGKGISGINSMKNGEHYTVIERDGIAKFSYQTGQKSGIIAEGNYESYEFSEDENKILLLKESQPIYRHSFLGKFEIKDLKSQKTISLNNGNPVQ